MIQLAGELGINMHKCGKGYSTSDGPAWQCAVHQSLSEVIDYLYYT